MKKEVENKNSFITDLDSSESSGDESDDIKEIPIENKKEIKKVIENYLLSSDEKTINMLILSIILINSSIQKWQ